MAGVEPCHSYTQFIISIHDYSEFIEMSFILWQCGHILTKHTKFITNFDLILLTDYSAQVNLL